MRCDLSSIAQWPWAALRGDLRSPVALIQNAKSFSLFQGKRTGSSQAALWPNSGKKKKTVYSSTKCQYPQGTNRKGSEGRWTKVSETHILVS